MAFVTKRASDKARGKAGKWTCHYKSADGKRKSAVGFTDKAASLQLAHDLEREARLVREGLVDPREKGRREASLRSVADHAEDYRLHLIAKGGTKAHAAHIKRVLIRLLAEVGVRSVAEIAPDQIQATLGRWRAKDKPPSARTLNHAIGAVKAFVAWLADSGRIEAVPRGMKALTPYNQEQDRRRLRRALTRDEIARLIAAAESCTAVKAPNGHPSATGPQRAILYRIALGTGFRANELRSLTPESFRLEGDDPEIVLAAKSSKNGKEARQPIRRDLAAILKPIVAAAEPGKPVLIVPKHTALMLREDLKAAGIPYRTDEGVLDFHALRSTYVTLLIERGANIKDVQALARHSTPTLTLGIYAKTSKGKLRNTIEIDD